MIRHLKIARDTAVKSRSQAMAILKTLIINAPAVLREILDQIRGKVALIRHIAAFPSGDIDTPLASAKAAMRALARRRLWLHEEIIAHDKELERLVTERAPNLMASLDISWHSDTDRSGNVDTCWRRSNAHPFTSSICKALWCLPNPCIQRQNTPLPIKPRRKSTSQRRPLSRGHCQDAKPLTNSGLC